MPKPMPDQKVEMVPIDQLEYWTPNPNQGDISAIQRSIEVNGWWGVVLVQRATNRIVAGNHRVEAAKRAGYTEVPVSYMDLTEEEAIRIVLADNRTARLGDDNDPMLAEILSTLASTELSLDGLGYDGDDLDKLIADLNPPEPETKSEGWRVSADVPSEELADGLVELIAGQGLPAKKGKR